MSNSSGCSGACINQNGLDRSLLGDDSRLQQNNELDSVHLFNFLAEEVAKIRDIAQYGYLFILLGYIFGDEPAQGNDIAVLDAYLSGSLFNVYRWEGINVSADVELINLDDAAFDRCYAHVHRAGFKVDVRYDPQHDSVEYRPYGHCRCSDGSAP